MYYFYSGLFLTISVNTESATQSHVLQFNKVNADKRVNARKAVK
jgi:hypothetical protein